MYYLYNENTHEIIAEGFETWEAAAEASQNYSPEVVVGCLTT